MITIPRETSVQLERALKTEWWVTNGLGGYAASTVVGANTRRYHGLLVAALRPPVERTVLVSTIDEEVLVNGQTIRLGVNEYENQTVYPDGYLYLQEAYLDGMLPSFVYATAVFRLTKTVWMEYGRQTTYLRYELAEDSAPVTLTLLPFCTYKDFHEETHGRLDWGWNLDNVEGGWRVTCEHGTAPFRILLDRPATFVPLHLWYWHYHHQSEAERGLDAREDLWLPGLVRTQLGPGEAATLVLTIEPDERLDRDAVASHSRARGREERLCQPALDDFERRLFLAADQFLVSREVRPAAGFGGVPVQPEVVPTVIAGYPWFADWGRDTMVSLEGLCLTTQRPELARGILLGFSQFISEGMLPNRFPDHGESPEYNTVDATLWYFHALARYLDATGDTSLLEALFPKLADILEWHFKGTRYNIHMDPADGLLYEGEPGYALTWMDAKVDDWVVTPRIGKPVEVNALWYNALCWMGKWAEQLGVPGESYAQAASRAGGSFDKFWYEAGGYLYDVIDAPHGNDQALRPNQVIALSLDHCAVPEARAKSVLSLVERELWTPWGLRTLSPRNPSFIGRYTGTRRERDGAYHQGTIWPWLIGPYVDAKLRFDPGAALGPAFFDPIRAHLNEAGVGSISEILEPNDPYRPVGCPAQAWSVAEVLRTYHRVLRECPR